MQGREGLIRPGSSVRTGLAWIVDVVWRGTNLGGQVGVAREGVVRHEWASRRGLAWSCDGTSAWVGMGETWIGASCGTGARCVGLSARGDLVRDGRSSRAGEDRTATG